MGKPLPIPLLLSSSPLDTTIDYNDDSLKEKTYIKGEDDSLSVTTTCIPFSSSATNKLHPDQNYYKTLWLPESQWKKTYNIRFFI
mmetsp:Transcript_44766/g.108153  ORF Transcript_44766/g.108153 Transcript_44766/m.108153 type:complete len:85 (-) Transcript_44766:3029-3283(-)